MAWRWAVKPMEILLISGHRGRDDREMSLSYVHQKLQSAISAGNVKRCVWVLEYENTASCKDEGVSNETVSTTTTESSCAATTKSCRTTAAEGRHAANAKGDCTAKTECPAGPGNIVSIFPARYHTSRPPLAGSSRPAGPRSGSRAPSQPPLSRAPGGSQRRSSSRDPRSRK